MPRSRRPIAVSIGSEVKSDHEVQTKKRKVQFEDMCQTEDLIANGVMDQDEGEVTLNKEETFLNWLELIWVDNITIHKLLPSLIQCQKQLLEQKNLAGKRIPYQLIHVMKEFLKILLTSARTKKVHCPKYLDWISRKSSDTNNHA